MNDDDHVPAYPATVELFPTRVRLSKPLRLRAAADALTVPAEPATDEPWPRCRCSHGPSVHTGGAGRCWQMPCCCE